MSHIITSPEFDEPIDPEAFIERLRLHSERIVTAKGSSHVIDDIKLDLYQYQAIIVKADGQTSWITAPARIVIESVKIPLWSRIKHYLHYKRWPNATYSTPLLQLKRFQISPLNVDIHMNDLSPTDINVNMKYKLALDHIAITLMRFIDQHKGDDRATIGVFKSPNGIWNANALRSWIELHEPSNTWSSNADVDTARLSDIIESVTFANAN